MSIFEAGMMICFGISWPFAIAKLIRTKSAKGISLLFLSLVLFGYMLGMIHKYLNNWDWVVYLYFYNAVLVAVQMGLYFRYERRAKLEKQ